MYLLTKKEGDLESGAYASVDEDGRPIVQFFVSKDDAICYNTQLEAIGQKLSYSEIDSEMVDKFVGILGHAYTIVDEGEMVIPRIETLQHALVELSPFRDLFQDPNV